MVKPAQLPIKLRAGGKTDVRAQFAALCFRVKKGKLKICLVTSRGTGRWVLPKGWPMHGQTPADAAATEAWEEAGLTGQPIDMCLGVYSYLKPLSETITAPVLAMVYPMRVTESHKNWPEHKERVRKWFTPAEAAARVDERELKTILAQFDPDRLPRSSVKGAGEL